MINTKTILIVSSTLILTGCSIGSIFDKKKPEPLPGERISVLELQKRLTPDTPLSTGQEFVLPPIWQNASWPQAGGYPNHALQNISLGELRRARPLDRAWKSDIGRGSTKSLPLTAQPVIAGGIIYTMDTDARISAFNADNGKKFWDIELENETEDEPVISGGLAHDNGVLYVTTGFDEIIALSAADGAQLWQKRLPAPSRAAPTVLGGRVYVSTIDSRLISLNAADGVGLWEYTGIAEVTGLLGAASPAANNEVVIATFSSGEITALRVENGSVAWSDNLSNVRRYGGGLESLSDIKAMPVIHKGLVIAISFGGKLAAIDEPTGTRIWNRDITGSQTPWVADNTIFVLSSDNQLVALNLINGDIFWISQLPRFEDEEDREDPVRWSGPVMGSGRLLLAGSNGELIEVSAHNGEIIQTTRIKKDIQIAPVIANNTLYLLAEDGSLMAYR